jgi:hypothetical protein
MLSQLAGRRHVFSRTTSARDVVHFDIDVARAAVKPLE